MNVKRLLQLTRDLPWATLDDIVAKAEEDGGVFEPVDTEDAEMKAKRYAVRQALRGLRDVNGKRVFKNIVERDERGRPFRRYKMKELMSYEDHLFVIHDRALRASKYWEEIEEHADLAEAQTGERPPLPMYLERLIHRMV